VFADIDVVVTATFAGVDEEAGRTPPKRLCVWENAPVSAFSSVDV
jgi:hypothetical protein